jgi:hypothetical protein
MKRIGNDEAGFSVALDNELGVVRVRAWGFWSIEVATAFAGTVAEYCHAGPRGGTLLMDMTGLKPMRDEGQQSFGALMDALPKLGIARTTLVIDSPLTKLQLLRLVAQHGRKDLVQFTAAAAIAVNPS